MKRLDRIHKNRLFYSLPLLLIVIQISFSSCQNAKQKTSESNGVESIDSADNLNSTHFLKNPSKRQAAGLVVQIYSNSLFVVQLSKKIVTYDIHAATKEVASYMIKKYTAFNKETQQMANKAHISLPDDISNAQHQKIKRISKSGGYEKDYFRTLLGIHKKTLVTLQSAEKSSNSDIHNWAKEGLKKVNKYIDFLTDKKTKIDSLPFK